MFVNVLGSNKEVVDLPFAVDVVLEEVLELNLETSFFIFDPHFLLGFRTLAAFAISTLICCYSVWNFGRFRFRYESQFCLEYKTQHDEWMQMQCFSILQHFETRTHTN